MIFKDMEAYRRGHNGPDSKLSRILGGEIPENPDAVRLLGNFTQNLISQFSSAILFFFRSGFGAKKVVVV